MKLLFSSLFVFITIFCSAQSTDTTKTVYANDNYKIEYPNNWQFDTSSKALTEFYILSPLENKNDKFRENINLIIQDLAGQNIDLKAYKKISEQQVKQGLKGTIISESAIKKAGNNEYYRLTYTATFDKFKLSVTSICFFENEKAYLLTFTSEQAKLKMYKKAGEQILSSFALIK